MVLNNGTGISVSGAYPNFTLASTIAPSQWANNGSDIYFNSGNVGIGTDIPSAKLEISGGDAIINGLTVGHGGSGNLSNSTFGVSALGLNSTGFGNTANGYNALGLNTGGTYNTATGVLTLALNTTGNSNTANGYFALLSNSTGSSNTGYGYGALAFTTTGYSNVGVGAGALYKNATKSNLVAVGDSALYNCDGGFSNTALGSKALYSNTTGYYNTATGYQALYSNTTGYYNTATGLQALYSNTTGFYNTATGLQALYTNTTGNDNIANGFSALYSNTMGGYNIAIGNSSLRLNTTGSFNIAIGSVALYSNTTGNSNTANGIGALNSNSTGSGNTGSGRNALLFNTTGNNNTALGYDAGVLSGNLSNATALGYGAKVNASNKAVIGDNSVTVIGGHVGWSILSDGRFKTNVKENVPGLTFINKLKPVTYNVDETKFAKFMGAKDSLLNADKEAYSKATQKIRTGFIAQEVEKTAKEINYDFDGVNHPQNDKDNYSLVYADFVPSLVKSVQELSAQNDELRTMNDDLKKENKTAETNLQKQIDELKAMLIGSVQSSENKAASSQIVELASVPSLQQNIPNPFTGVTVINCNIPVNNGNAYLNFYNQSGALLKSLKVTGTAKNSITLKANELAAGTYKYALIIDGKIIDSKQMNLVK